MTAQLPLALCCGDPAGIGPEVIAGALRADKLQGQDCVLIGPELWAQPLAAELGITYAGVGPADFVADLGAPTLAGASVALAAMQAAAAGCRAARYRAVVTGPVSKYWLRQVGFEHPGQTEFFAAEWGGAPTMAFVGRELKVVLATWHIPLREVADALTAACLEQAVRRAHDLAQACGVATPRIGVCGLNPHAGEAGILGLEERDVLDPALDRLRPEFPGLSTCLPGDTVFFRQRRGEFDVVVSAYHDQGLAAVKTLEFDSAVNVTLGLPHVRTSPDHGTAFDLAGKYAASAESMLAAVQVARQLTFAG
ncbi:MAG: 4-hydroxythreonine-4-phosphate dehydrogenase [Lentimonas sp.]|jgi:4-hydroxythreonine-4-phosphate dehydrogenase